jgi:hypothetical protein
MKDTFYFSHDYNARQDIKIKKLLVKYGMCGYGVFWAIIEDLYNNANALPTDYESIAYELRIDIDIVKSVINDFDLFVIDGNEFGSKSIENRLNERNEKSKKARESANYRWSKNKTDANALRTESDSNAIKEIKGKERKGKENKGKEIKENIIMPEVIKTKTFKQWTLEDFENDIKKYSIDYDKKMLLEFYNYWKESDGKKMKFQLQKTWETNLRLSTWKSRQKDFAPKETKESNREKVGKVFQEALINMNK